MKLATFRRGEAPARVGRVDADGCLRPLYLPGGRPADDLLALIDDPALLAAAREGEETLAMDEVALLAPIPRPRRNLFCVGKNYRAHAREFGRSGYDSGPAGDDDLPAHPIVFTKTPQTVVGHGARVWDAAGVSAALDYEAELAVIVGRGGRGIRRTEAMAHVWGYTILNDVTARDWQQRHRQWDLGKSFDTFAPMGPVAVTADELDGGDLRVRCWINGELRQDARTRDLIFDIPTLIETLSAGITLLPGDIIATGTPAGVGAGFRPPRFLARGDEMAIEIEGIGRLVNRIGD